MALEDDDGNESDDEPVITCGSQVKRLKIDKLIDLANSKLLACFATVVPVPLTTTCWRGPLLAHGNYESSLV
jgi:hypothetical protein